LARPLRAALALSLLAIAFGCSDKSSDPGDTDGVNKGQIFQVPGCAAEGLAKPSWEDSCFSYQFDTRLLIDFCVQANCCPDSNRFELSYAVLGDTIVVAAEDTAASLCDCICPYVIHLELHDLPLDHYVFACDYDVGIVYEEDIWRQDE